MMLFLGFAGIAATTFLILVLIDRRWPREEPPREPWSKVVNRSMAKYVDEKAERLNRSHRLCQGLLAKGIYLPVDNSQLIGRKGPKPIAGSPMEGILRKRVLAAKQAGEGRFRGSPVYTYTDIRRRMVQVWWMGDDDSDGRWMTEQEFRAHGGEFPKHHLVGVVGEHPLEVFK